jgi:hypothetical protein
MPKKKKNTEPAAAVNNDEVQPLRELLNNNDPEHLDPKLREDPGLLPLTEDPRERRLKRTTM